MTCCSSCGRRFRPRRCIAPAAQLAFTWPPPRSAAPPRSAPPVRLLLLPGCLDAAGEPRPALLPAGAKTPIIFRNVAAALAAKRRMEAR